MSPLDNAMFHLVDLTAQKSEGWRVVAEAVHL